MPTITLERVMRENPGITLNDAFQKLNFLRAQEEAKEKKGDGLPLPLAVMMPAAALPRMQVGGGAGTLAIPPVPPGQQVTLKVCTGGLSEPSTEACSTTLKYKD